MFRTNCSNSNCCYLLSAICYYYYYCDYAEIMAMAKLAWQYGQWPRSKKKKTRAKPKPKNLCASLVAVSPQRCASYVVRVRRTAYGRPTAEWLAVAALWFTGSWLVVLSSTATAYRRPWRAQVSLRRLPAVRN